jgi:polyribonucleotide 5'-hydroxyl-kinase
MDVEVASEGQGAAGGGEERPWKDWVLEKETELRLEAPEDTTVDVKLLTGTAEVFGTEMARNKSYSLSPRLKVAIFTWHSCTMRVEGEPQVIYVSEDTPMVMYLNSHIAVDQLRHRREQEGQTGPRVLVAGATDVGKSSLCRLLLSYAARLGRQPCLIDCDVGQGSVSMPGTICALPVERPADIETGEFNKQASLVYTVGHTSPAGNYMLYTTLVSSLAHMFLERCKTKPATKTGGCVINTCGWVDGLGYKALLHIAQAFAVDVVLVLDHERLFLDLQRDLPPTTDIVPLPKSGGVRAESESEMAERLTYCVGCRENERVSQEDKRGGCARVFLWQEPSCALSFLL